MAFLVRAPRAQAPIGRSLRQGHGIGTRSAGRSLVWALGWVLLTSSGLWHARAAAAGLDAQSRQSAVEAIPLELLTADAQAKISQVVSRPSIYRQLPPTVIESDPEMYLFLVRNPEVVVNIWQLLGVTKVKVDRVGDFLFDATDGSGTVCRVELIYGDQNTHVLYAEGSYEGPLLRNLIRGRCVLILRSEYARTADQQAHVTSRLDMFVHFGNVGAELLARTLHPLVGRAADHNFIESTRFLGQVSSAAKGKAIAMQQLAGKLTNLEPETRQKFAELAAAVNHRAALQAAQQFAPASVPAEAADGDFRPVLREVGGIRSSQRGGDRDAPPQVRR